MRWSALAFLVPAVFPATALLASVEVVNVGVDASLGFEIQGNLVAFRTSEARSGNTDLNGDGDTSDFILQVYDFSTGVVTNTGMEASGGILLGNGWVAFTALESRQGGGDLNGDGDTFDFVQHVYDHSTQTVINLKLAAASFELQGHLLAFTVLESSQGNLDLNGDGDSRDGVLHVFDAATGLATSTGMNASGGFVVNGDHVAFAVSEASEGGADLNNDGDTNDLVLHLYASKTRSVTSVQRATTGQGFQLDAGLGAFLVPEASDGGNDLNGDGDIGDDVLHLFNPGDTSTTNLALAVEKFQLESGRLAFSVSEAGQGSSDLNGDGDSFDQVLHLHDASGTSNQEISAHAFQLSSDHVAFAVQELEEGNGDFNGDGDSGDLVLHLLDLASGTVTNLGTDATLGFELDGDMLLAFGTSEDSQGNDDLNQDGDTSDFVLHVFDIATGTLINLEVDPSGGFQTFQVDGRVVSFGVKELAQGTTDLNGDGDANDVVLHVFDVRTLMATNLGLDATLGHQLDAGRIAFVVTESNQAMSDLNGDGDAGDVVLHVANISLSIRERILALVNQVHSLGLPRGVEASLVVKLELALRFYDKDRPRLAARMLHAFQRSVTALNGKKIDRDDADALIEESEKIIWLLRDE